MTYEALTKAGVPLFAYGNFITVAINFIILAFVIFVMVKQVNRMKREAPPAGPGADARGRGPAARNPGRAEEIAAGQGGDRRAGAPASAAAAARPTLSLSEIKTLR